jgi:protease-4
MDESLPPLPPPPGSDYPRPPAPPPPPPPLTSAPPVIASISLPPKPPKSGSGWKVLAIVLMVLFLLMIFGKIISAKLAPRIGHTEASDRKLEEVVLEHTNGNDKIAVVEISGVISGGQVDNTGMSLVEYVKEQFKSAAEDDDVKAVILKVNSPGGEVLASDEIYNVIRKFEENEGKPVVVSMGALAASGGYYISSACRWIVANELTLTGSIGVIMDGYNYRGLMDKVGVRPQVYKSGRFKDMLSPEREPDMDKLSAAEQKDRLEEDQMVQTLINDTFAKFKDVVKKGRGWAAKENTPGGAKLADNWEDFADGRVLEGKQALSLGFVDELGDFETAVRRAETLSGIKSASLIQYREPFDLGSVLARVLGKTEVPAIKVDFGFNLPKLQAGLPYFMDLDFIPR